MDEFLYDLAYMKYKLWNELFNYQKSAYTSEECFKRIEKLARYDQLLKIIDMLPVKETLDFYEIEKEFFGDAPYVK